MCVIDAGHFNTERIIADRLAQLIKENFPEVEVIKSNMEEDPFNFIDINILYAYNIFYR